MNQAITGAAAAASTAHRTVDALLKHAATRASQQHKYVRRNTIAHNG
jgi:hypothetical protein